MGAPRLVGRGASVGRKLSGDRAALGIAAKFRKIERRLLGYRNHVVLTILGKPREDGSADRAQVREHRRPGHNRAMSTVNITKFPGEEANLEAVLRAHAGDFEAIARYARSIGCLHHRIVARSHELVVIDEWEDIGAAVKKFWFLPEAMSLMREAGVRLELEEGGNYHPIWDPTEF